MGFAIFFCMCLEARVLDVVLLCQEHTLSLSGFPAGRLGAPREQGAWWEESSLSALVLQIRLLLQDQGSLSKSNFL